jgi:NADH-quinone oxidoreductase subunit N
MVSYNEYTLNWEASILGQDFLFFLPEVFLALALSALLVFGACVYKPAALGQTPIFRDVVSSLSAYTAFLTLLVLVSSPYTQTGVSKNLFYGLFVANDFVFVLKFFLLLMAFGGLLVMPTALRRDKINSFEYTILLLFSVLGMLLLVCSANLLSL